MLTERANKYLASLKRASALPASLVEKSLFEQGAPRFDAWLEFHDRYAGYVEQLGSGDFAVWGIVFETPNWLDPLQAQVDREQRDPIWYVTCADVHPSYVYRLDQEGGFFAPPASSFDVKIERDALVSAFSHAGKTRRAAQKELHDPEFVSEWRRQLAASTDLQLVPEASDAHFRYYEGKTALVFENAKLGAIQGVWRRV
jgi:hypothetical protein